MELTCGNAVAITDKVPLTVRLVVFQANQRVEMPVAVVQRGCSRQETTGPANFARSGAGYAKRKLNRPSCQVSRFVQLLAFFLSQLILEGRAEETVLPWLHLVHDG